MEELLLEYQSKIAKTGTEFKRYLLGEIDLKNRLIAVKGSRGVGKTTLLLQLIKLRLDPKSSLYISLDHIYFYDNTLYDLAKKFSQLGGTHLVLDEVHKYPNWSREIKLIYDNFSDLSVIFTSSSMLEIHKSESDLSRRAVVYSFKELSFREFLAFDLGISFESLELNQLLSEHTSIAEKVIQQIKPLKHFGEYLKHGAYPYYKENIEAYHQKLLNTINLIIEVDINAVENLNYDTILKLKKLLKAVATSVPFTPNISKLSTHVGLSRNSLTLALKMLERAGMVNELYKPSKGIGVLTKPEKLYLNNTNLIYALASQNANIGNIRETFILNQLKDLHDIHLSSAGDFLINETITLEVGGKNKSHTQIKDLSDAYLVKDQIEIGIHNTIPVWMFGFLY